MVKESVHLEACAFFSYIHGWYHSMLLPLKRIVLFGEFAMKGFGEGQNGHY